MAFALMTTENTFQNGEPLFPYLSFTGKCTIPTFP